LATHELPPGFHTIARHVGLDEAALAARIRSPRGPKIASTFATLEDAEQYTYAALGAHGPEIASWLTSGLSGLALTTHFDHAVGTSMRRGSPGRLVEAFRVTTVLRQT